MPIPAAGEPAPDFDLPASTGVRFRLSAQRGKPVVLYFYPEDDTAGCTVENRQFDALVPQFAAAGAIVAGISEDSIDSHRRFCGKYGLRLPLLADPEHLAIAAYGVWGPKVTFGHHLVGLVRTTFLIDADGRVAKSWRVTRINGHAERVLEAAQALAGRTGIAGGRR